MAETIDTEQTPGEIPEPQVPDWLKRLQQESWQAEILISGGAIFGLFSLIDEVPTLVYVLRHATTISPPFINNLQGLSGVVVMLLLEGFSMHLLLRGYWIGLVGLDYVFPRGVRTEQLRFKGRFGSLFRQPNNTTYLLRLDKLCSLVFASTFLAIFSFVSVISFTLLILFVATSDASEWLVGTVLIIMALLALLQLIDFFSLGRLKRKAWFARIYYPVYFFLSILTLSFLYRRLYYTIVSNIKPLYFFAIILLPFALMVSILPNLKGDTGQLSDKFVPIDTRPDRSFLFIPEPVVRDSVLEFTISHFPRLEEEIVKALDSADSHNTHPTIRGPIESLNLAVSRYQVFIDTARIENAHWLPLYNTEASFLFSKIVRFTGTVRISALQRGTHRLVVKIQSELEEFNPKSRDFYAHAYFIIP